MSDLNILQQAIEFPIQTVVSVGKSGDGFNMFRAPSAWIYTGTWIATGTAWTILTPPPDRSLRIYRYHIAFASSLAAAYINVVLGFGNPIAQGVVRHLYPAVAASITGGQSDISFGPVGIGGNANLPWTLLNASAQDVLAYITLQYSTEAWGQGNSDGDDRW